MSDVYEQEAGGRHGGALQIHPPLLAAALLIIALVLHLIGAHGGRTFRLHQFLGLLLVAAGTGLSGYAAALFAARETTKNPYGKPAAFVISPPYTVMRNPMYVGLATILFGFAVFFWLTSHVNCADPVWAHNRSNGDSTRRRNHGTVIWSAVP